MFNFLLLLLSSLFNILFSNRKDLILTLMVLKKENQIYKRQFNQKQIQDLTKRSDRILFSIISNLSKRAVRHLTIIKPSPLLDWQRRFIKSFWSYKHKTPGRKPVSSEIKKLILEMKQTNPLWGCHRIADELKKVGIDLNPTTVNRIIQTFRKQGKIQPTGSWKKFLKAHWDTLFAMDFMTIDTLLGKRLYLLLIIELNLRKIVRFDITQNPTREFVKQRIQLFSEDFPEQLTLIYDNAPQFTTIDYSAYEIDGVNTAPAAPNMNAFIERTIGSIWREALDHFLLISEKQIKKIVQEYVDYYNHYRPHQGINRIPDGENCFSFGSIKKKPVLGGLHHHYYRSSA
ncbi:MAG: integrase core domain-containing protein [Spirochaetales bacterium]|uniref:Integrase core domain-containing protein n=1 Tax=Candidatus Thalassospirochaeta sargassi TaxID=3119039 RepID=A0AAJ1MN58_9SPIO|nr:integrase core domain-containing protein [Spirochaetales bacterium]